MGPPIESWLASGADPAPAVYQLDRVSSDDLRALEQDLPASCPKFRALVDAALADRTRVTGDTPRWIKAALSEAPLNFEWSSTSAALESWLQKGGSAQ